MTRLGLTVPREGCDRSDSVKEGGVEGGAPRVSQAGITPPLATLLGAKSSFEFSVPFAPVKEGHNTETMAKWLRRKDKKL